MRFSSRKDQYLPFTKFTIRLLWLPEGLEHVSSHHARPQVRVVRSSPHIRHNSRVGAEMCIVLVECEWPGPS
ncbi:hypothetical protein E2C01_026111 [Portunus trituberculatus]|uniref:Uncharacterized protein n=1 Tax=Portunus trituberculatus TaxID=210409 RepID=A0A5B7EEW0_PORTR|nr:hypothetical protein [Portunus trituberculatus]